MAPMLKYQSMLNKLLILSDSVYHLVSISEI